MQKHMGGAKVMNATFILAFLTFECLHTVIITFWILCAFLFNLISFMNNLEISDTFWMIYWSILLRSVGGVNACIHKRNAFL